MKIGFITLIRLAYHSAIFALMRYLQDHITDKSCVDLIGYWEEVSRAKLRRILKDKHDRMFN